MQVVELSRETYRRRHDADYLSQVRRRYAPCLVIPEGGGNAAGVRGCMEIAALVNDLAPGIERVVLPVGTGTSLAGVAAGLGPTVEVAGIAALRGIDDLDSRVRSGLLSVTARNVARWHILHDYHCGGFARVSPELRAFIEAFESTHGIPLEPVYTGKMLFAIHQLTTTGRWNRRPLLAIHTGGLQGRRGYAW